MTSNEMVVRTDEMPYSPDQQLDMASKVARALIGVVTKKPKPVIVNGEIYLEYEDWQFVGQMFHLSVSTDAEPVEMHGVKGFKGTAKLIDTRNGLVVGGAESYCMQDEDRWADRPMFQLNSMAQTRAGAKSLRNRLSWVVMLAGYKTTPAEEMVGDEKPRTPDHKFYCKEHKTVWFKSANMKHYAHPIVGTKEWCNMPETPIQAQEPTTKEPTPIVESAVVAKEATKKTPPISQVPPSQTPQNIGELMRWAYTHGETYTPSWVNKQLGVIPNNADPSVIAKAQKDLMQLTGWER